jgi:hypothetical protein
MSKLKVDILANSADSASTPIADVINGSARAFVNFNGTGTVAILAAYNVSSITDNGNGDYTVNFTNAMPDANYASPGSANLTGASGVGSVPFPRVQTAASLRVLTGTTSSNALNTGAGVDCALVSVAIFR